MLLLRWIVQPSDPTSISSHNDIEAHRLLVDESLRSECPIGYRCIPQVRLARYEQDRYRSTAYGADLFDPLSYQLPDLCQILFLTFCVTLSNESGVSTEKAIKMTCALEYDNGRNLSYSS